LSVDVTREEIVEAELDRLILKRNYRRVAEQVERYRAAGEVA
jgi:hypothetical protein